MKHVASMRRSAPHGHTNNVVEREAPRKPHNAQLLLSLDLGNRGDPGDVLISDVNISAISLTRAPSAWPSGLCCLVGPPASGKTLIARAALPDAVLVDARDPDIIFGLVGQVSAETRLILENVDRVYEEEIASKKLTDAQLPLQLDFHRCDGRRAASPIESALFHLFNIVDQRGARLVATARSAPSEWPVRLPDLRTRLAAAPLALIDPPDDALLVRLLEKLFRLRGLAVEPKVVDYLTTRMERTYEAALTIVEQLNAASLTEQCAVTKMFAGRTLGWR